MDHNDPCPRCHGAGEKISETSTNVFRLMLCWACNGTGLVGWALQAY
jgi:DnaJ-class molecular chaperone